MDVRNDPQLISSTADWWVVEKPAGWLTVPGRSQSPVLIDWLRQCYGDAWVVHRLDEETSGVVLFARSPEAHRRACDWFFHQKVRKVYEFLASGSPKLPVFRVESLIEGKSASTQVEVVQRRTFESSQAGFFLGRARPVTGRRHQIRIHLKRSGFPLLGDSRYGGLIEPTAGLKISRVALHARTLSLPTGEVFDCPLPDDFSQWSSDLGLLRQEVSG